MDLFKFEIKKIVSQKKFIISWVIVLLLFSIYIFFTNKQDNIYKVYSLPSIQSVIDQTNITITDLKNKLDENVSDTIKLKLNDFLIDNEKTLYNYQMMKEGILKNDFNLILKNEKEIYERESAIDTNKISNINEINAKIEKNEYLLENNIVPINEGTNMSAVNFLNLALRFIAPMLIGIIIILNSSSNISQELDYGTIQLLLFQNISRKKIIFNKILASIFINIVSCSLVLIFFTTILSFINSPGNLNYPIYVDVNGLIELVPVKYLILKNMLILFILIIFLTLFSILISTLTKSSIESISISVTICVGSIIIFNNIQLPEIIKSINPFSYLTGSGVLTSGFHSSPIINNIDIGYILIVFTIYIFVILLLTINIFDKKEFCIEN